MPLSPLDWQALEAQKQAHKLQSQPSGMALNESDFEALGVIGEGSYGTVVKARERATGRLVAIKKFRDAELDKTTKRELEALRRVRHPGVCALVATYSERGKLRIAMEYVGGGTLLDVLEAHPRGVPAPRAASLARSLVDAVAAMLKSSS